MRIRCMFLLLVTLCLASCQFRPPPPPRDDTTNRTPATGAVQPTATDPTAFTLSSVAVQNGGMLPPTYTCDGSGDTLPLSWTNAPAATASYAIVMHHTAAADDVHWYWVLYNIPAAVTQLAPNSSGVGTLGTNSVNDRNEYAPPCSKGPGPKTYTYTIYALSAPAQFDTPQVDRDTLLDAITTTTLASTTLDVVYSRP